MKTRKDTIIIKYIEFAVENGFQVGKYNKIVINEGNVRFIFLAGHMLQEVENYEMIELITSKPFIDAIARGLIKGKDDGEIHTIKGFGEWIIYDNDDLFDFTKYLLKEQALAIYINELPLFIKKILGKN